MVREKRKGRLDKSSGSAHAEFIGFSAFAATNASTQQQPPSDVGSVASSTTGDLPSSNLWSPVYTGKDESLQQLFPRIRQKRDATTKVKALQELQTFLSSRKLVADDTDDRTLRRHQIQALQHYAWLYFYKLHYDPAAAVRAQAVAVWQAAMTRIPKAVAQQVAQQPELLGMFWAAAADPAAEVRAEVRFQEDCWSHTKDWPWQEGLVDRYAARILSYGRPSVLHEALFAKTTPQAPKVPNNKKKGQQSQEQSTQSSSWTEEQRDAADERFERIVGTCLDALSLWLQQQLIQQQPPCTADNVGNSSNTNEADATPRLLPDTCQAWWWKTLTSNKVALRQKTYRLLATVCSCPQQLGLPHDMTNSLAQALSTEKSVTNITTLLETVVAFLSYQKKQHYLDATNNNNTSAAAAAAAALVKPCCKVLKKACLGAQVRLWGPTLLPLVALLPTHESRLLQAAWDGRDLTLGDRDRFQLAAALAECTSFVLLRRQQQRQQLDDDEAAAEAATTVSEQDMTTAREIALLWLETLRFYLINSSRKPAATAMATSQESLLQHLGNDLVQLQEASSSRPNCIFYSLADWFWPDGLDWLSQCDPAPLTDLLRTMRAISSHKELSEPADIRLVPHIRTRFLSLLADYQSNSGAVPSREAYEFFLVALESCGPQNMFTDNGSLEKFVMNEVLRWIILHTSEISTHPQATWLVQYDFGMLHCCLNAVENSKRTAALWESLFQQMVAARCDLHWLVAGLRVLVAKSEDDAATLWLCCPTLDTFAIATAESHVVQMAPHASADAEDSSVELASADDDVVYQKRLDFFRLCLGIAPDSAVSNIRLVDRPVISAWIDCACQPDRGAVDPLLEVLLELLARDKSDVSDEQAQRIALHSWLVGGHLYRRHVPTILGQWSSSRVESFLSTASSLLKDQLEELSTRPEKDIDDSAVVEAWSGRAVRFLGVCKSSSCGFAAPSLRSLGLLGCVSWEAHPNLLYKCTMALFQALDAQSERLSLIQRSDADASLDLSQILIAIADGTSIASLDSKQSAYRSDRCEKFISAIGGHELDTAFLDATIEKVVVAIHKRHKGGCESTGELELIANEVSALSHLIEFSFVPVLSAQPSDLKAEDIKEGDQVWYISDPKDPEKRDFVFVSKVHYDAQDGYYFSIRLQPGDKEQERQTVLERLRKDKLSVLPTHGILEDKISQGERVRRSRVRDLIMSSIIRPFLSSAAKGSASTALLGELLSVLGGVVGMGGKRGVGSVNYEVFQIMVATDSGICTALAKNEFEAASHLLWTTALELGYSLNSTPRTWSLRQIQLDFVQSSEAALDLYDKQEVGSDPHLDRSILAWITSTLEHLLIDSEEQDNNNKIRVAYRIICLLFRLATSLLSGNEKQGFSYDKSIACRAVYEGTRLLAEYSPKRMLTADNEELEECVVEASNLQSDALLSLLKSFTTAEEAPLALGTPFSVVSEIFALMHKDTSVRDKLSRACQSNAGGIAKALFSPARRCLAFRLLELVASRNKPIQPSDGEVTISTRTQAHLTSWLEGLDEEESSQLKEDVYIVAEWIPQPVMDEVESWVQEMDYESLDKSQTVGQLLSWLCFLRFVDAAAPSDFRNRPAFISYLRKCEAVNHILTLALLHEETINDGKRSAAPSVLLAEELVVDNSDFKLSDISSVVLFRSIEVLPSLSKRWYEEECPKVYMSPVQTFVEKHVGPKILKRELERIRNASGLFGEMTVNASAVSREVTAQYIQDDFTLTVLISLPASFPLRSAEVDCSKTLGVSQSRWKRWSLQITLMLNNQGGTLQDALLLWKDNVDKEFEGVEACPVCYSVLHVKTHKLPSLECKTCHNRFHVDCLTQWFRSSGKSQCVMCQQPWQGTRIL